MAGSLVEIQKITLSTPTASAVLTASVAGSIIKGGAGAVPNIITTHNSRVPGGKGGDLGAIGYGANMDTTVTGPGGSGRGLIAGDETFKLL